MEDRFFLHMFGQHEERPNKVYHLKGNVMSEVDFSFTEKDGHRHWSLEIDTNSSKVISGENLMFEEYLGNTTENFQKYNRLKELSHQPGDYYPRIFRPIFNIDYRKLIRPYGDMTVLRDEFIITPDYLPRDRKMAIDAIWQLEVIIGSLEDICRTVHPSPENLNAFGHQIRDTLILACTEIEAQLLGIYEANCSLQIDRANTMQYVQLRDVMKLNDYIISFNNYPDLPSFTPFKDWDYKKPTESLQWYSAYNAVKHNREKQFKKASLQNLLSAVAAIYILLRGQYGDAMTEWNDLFRSFFKLEQEPEWSYQEYYLPPFKNGDWNKLSLF